MLTPGGGHRVRGGAVSLAGTRGFPPSHLVDTRRFVLGSTTTHIFLGIKLSKSLFSKVPGDRQGGWVEPKKNYIILFLISFLKTRSWFCLSFSQYDTFPPLKNSGCLDPGSFTLLLDRLLWPYRRILSQICLIQMATLQMSVPYWKDENGLSVVY